jgi:hypothetical protein
MTSLNSRAAWKVRKMRARVPRGPHLICYRCDSLDVNPLDGRCKWCDNRDMVDFCHRRICGACLEPEESARREA